MSGQHLANTGRHKSGKLSWDPAPKWQKKSVQDKIKNLKSLCSGERSKAEFFPLFDIVVGKSSSPGLVTFSALPTFKLRESLNFKRYQSNTDNSDEDFKLNPYPLCIVGQTTLQS